MEQLKNLGGEVTIGLEATGHYWLALFDFLTKNGYAVASGSGVPYLLSQVEKYAARSLCTKWAGPISIGIDAGTLAWYINNGPLRQKIILTVTQVDLTVEYPGWNAPVL